MKLDIVVLKLLQNKKDLNDVTAAPFLVSFSQLPAAKKEKTVAVTSLRSFIFHDDFITRLSQLLLNSGQNVRRNKHLISKLQMSVKFYFHFHQKSNKKLKEHSCSLFFFSWLMDHVIYLKLRKNNSLES